jgi:hypothetical protein
LRIKKKIRSPGLLYLAARAEQHLIDLMLGARGQRRPQRRGVIAAGFHHAHLRRRARVDVVDQDAQRLHAACKVIPYRTCEHEQSRLGARRRCRADVRRRTDEQRPKIKRTRRFGNRVAAALDHRSHHVRELLGIGLGQHQLPCALPQALNVPIHAKYVYRSVSAAKRLESLEAGAGVMQHVRGGTELERRHRFDLALAPLLVLIGRNGHVRGQ